MTDEAQVEVSPFSGVSELVLEVSDLEGAKRFYSDLLGLPVVDRWPEAVWLLAGSTRIGLWRSVVGIAGARGGAHVHFALHLGDAGYDALVRRLRRAGLEPHEETFEAFDGSRAAYVTDPDGNVVEFWTWDVGLSGTRTAEQPAPGR
jgi:catechol 2,3-dioxygenase-like lactoylglutathione lyase family enzyme